jgi:hypothetical protein
MAPIQAEGSVVESSSPDGISNDQQTAVEELDAFRFEGEEPLTDETDLETGCLSCS